MLIGYVRSPRGDMSDAPPLANRLRYYGCEEVVVEAGAGSRWRRPKLAAITETLGPGDIVVHSLDHLSWSLPDLLQRLEDFELAGIGFQSISEGVDTTTPAGRMMMLMVGSILDFERTAFRARTLDGLQKARAAGRVTGPDPKLTADQQAEVLELVASGMQSASSAARQFGVHPSTISRLIKRHALSQRVSQARRPR